MFDRIETRRAEVERHRENRAREAKAFAKFESYAQGPLEFEQPIDFGLTFVDEPFITYGSQLDLDELGETLGVEPGDTPTLPLTIGYVTEWDRDERGFYLGAWTAVRVWFPTQDAVPTETEVHVYHHFTFAAVAIKDVPVEGRD